MKKIKLTILLVIMGLCTYAQDCDCADKVISITGSTPFAVSIEGGLAFDNFSGYIGIKSYSQDRIDGKGLSITESKLAPYIKGTYKVIGVGDVFRGYLEAYGGYKIYGGGIKLGFILDPHIMAIIEPQWNYEQGKQINVGISVRL
jgi:hypothetical protein